MTQEILNSTNNIQIPHTVSFWFQKDWTGEYIELGDILVDAVSLSPDFLEFRSYRNSLNALRKRLLQAKNASIAMTLNEPNIVNLQRVTYGGAIASNQSITVYEGRHMEADSDGGGTFIDLADAGEDDFTGISITGMYATTDVLQATNLLGASLIPNTDGKVYFDATDTGVDDGETVYVTYEIAVTGMYASEIYGTEDATIEGAGRLQARNNQGGIMQIWDLASIQLAPNGDMSFGLDAVQTVPLLATLQERSGTFGKVYTK